MNPYRTASPPPSDTPALAPSRPSDSWTLVFAVLVLAFGGFLSHCMPPDAGDVAQRAEHVVVVGSYERRLDACRESTRTIEAYDACEREATRDLCAARPELRSKAFCREVSDGGQ